MPLIQLHSIQMEIQQLVVQQQEYYKVSRFGKAFRFALLIIALLPIWGYMEIDFSEMIPLWQYLGFIALICYMAVVLIVVLNSNLIKE